MLRQTQIHSLKEKFTNGHDRLNTKDKTKITIFSTSLFIKDSEISGKGSHIVNRKNPNHEICNPKEPKWI